jgi:Zinc finger, C3HC4 type (RING finger)
MPRIPQNLLSSINRFPVTFKVAYSEFRQEYNLCPDWTVRDLVNFMEVKCRQDMGLENVELVPSSQSGCYPFARNNDPFMREEEGPALSIETDDNANKKLKELFGPTLQVFFYVRVPRTVEQLIEELENTVVVPEVTPSVVQRVCPICTDREPNLLFMPCRHLACCSECGTNPTMNSCHICRSPINSRIVVFTN